PNEAKQLQIKSSIEEEEAKIKNMSEEEIDQALEGKEPPRRIRKAEAVLAKRTSKISIVLERCYDSHNHQAVIRTAESLGIQNLWTVLPVEWKKRIVPRHARKHEISSEKDQMEVDADEEKEG